MVVQASIKRTFVESDTKPGLTAGTGLPPEKSQSLVSTSPLHAISQALSSHPFSHTIPSLSCSLPKPLCLCDTSLYHLYTLYFPLFNTFLYTQSTPHDITHTGSWFPPLSLLSFESSPQVILMTLPKALSDPGCQLCQSQIIWARYYRGCFPLGLQKPLISLGLGDVCRPALFSQVVIKEDEQDRGVYSKTCSCTGRGGMGWVLYIV